MVLVNAVARVPRWDALYWLAKMLEAFLGKASPRRDATMDMMIAWSQDDVVLHLDPALEPNVASHGKDASSKDLQSHFATLFFCTRWP